MEGGPSWSPVGGVLALQRRASICRRTTAGDHKGPTRPRSTTLAPTDVERTYYWIREIRNNANTSCKIAVDCTSRTTVER